MEIALDFRFIAECSERIEAAKLIGYLKGNWSEKSVSSSFLCLCLFISCRYKLLNIAINIQT